MDIVLEHDLQPERRVIEGRDDHEDHQGGVDRRLEPGDHGGMLSGRSLEGATHVVNDDFCLGELADQRLKAGGIARLKMQLHRQAVIGRHLPQTF